MNYLKLGVSNIYFNNEYIGTTKRNKNVTFNFNTIYENINDDTKTTNIDSIIKGREVSVSASIDFTEENFRKFPTGQILKGKLVIENCDESFQIVINDAEITSIHNNDYKATTDMGIDLMAVAVQNFEGEDVQIIELLIEVDEIQEYMQLEYIEGGTLNQQFSLISDYVYLADDGYKYLNTGGNRDWTEGEGTPDEDFIPATFKYILENWITTAGGIINGDLTANSFNTSGENELRSTDKTTLGPTESRTIRKEYLDANNIIRASKNLEINTIDEESYSIDIRDNTGAITKQFTMTRTGIYVDGEKIAIASETEKYTQLGYTYFGLLEEQTQLFDFYVYLADDGIKYLNIAGDRSWTAGTKLPDAGFIPATLKYVFDNWISQSGGVIDGELTSNKFLTVGGNTTRILHNTNIDNVSLRNISEEITDNNDISRLYKNLEITALDEESYTIDIRDNTGTTTKQLKIARDGIYIDGYKIKKIDDFDYHIATGLTITDATEVIVHSITHYFEIGVYKIDLSSTYVFPDSNDYFEITTYFDASPVIISRITPNTNNEIETVSNFSLLEITTEGTHTFEIGMILSSGGTSATLTRSSFYIDWKKEL